MIRINECLCDSEKCESVCLLDVIIFICPPQLIPEAYLMSPLLFPFPSTSHNILGTSAVHGITEDGRLVSRILPNECCWFARAGHPIARIHDGLMVRIPTKPHWIMKLEVRNFSVLCTLKNKSIFSHIYFVWKLLFLFCILRKPNIQFNSVYSFTIVGF